jgi:hypothetical protein
MIDLDERPTTKSLPRFVPVIFANGEDDDGPGLQACFDNEAVQFDDRIYEPGEPVSIFGRRIVICAPIVSKGLGRHKHFENCHFEPRF